MSRHHADPYDDAPLDPATETGGGGDDSLLRIMRLIQLRQTVVLWTIAATLAVGVSYYAVAPRVYRATSRLMVVDQTGAEMASMSEQAAAEGMMATHRELVRSPEVVKRAIERLPPEHRIDFLEEPPHDWIGCVLDNLSSNTIRKTNLINVRYDSSSPEAAAAVVQAVIDAYLEYVGETHRGTAADVLDVLTGERKKLEQTLAEKQLALQASRERVGHLALPDREDVVDPIVGRAIHFNDALLATQSQRLSLQSSLATLHTAMRNGEDLSQYMGLVEENVGQAVMLAAMGMGDNDLKVLGDQQNKLIELRSELLRVSPYYGDSHPDVINLRAQIAATEQYLASYRSDAAGRPRGYTNEELGPMLVGMLQQTLDQTLARELQLAESFEAARQEASRQSGDLVKLDMLAREVERIERLHDLLFEKIAATDIHQIQAPIRASIVEEPLPPTNPHSPDLRMTLAMSLFGGLLLGVGLVYLQDQLDDRFDSPEEMAAQLGRQVLSVVRELKARPGHGLAAVQMHSDPQATESEAFRTLRTAISLTGDSSDRLVVSSSEPGDGKTTVSSNLAVSYAQMGRRTLLLDCDLRKPGLTALFDLKGKAGVTDVLTCDDDIARVAQGCVLPTELGNLDIIPSGPRRPDPAELLLRPQFAELLAWAETRYDQVIIDCPPVLAVSDAQIAARLADGVILVVTPEKNHRRLVSRACDSFNAPGINLIGVVANRISEQAGKGYGYGYGYGYGHEEGEEEALPDHHRYAA